MQVSYLLTGLLAQMSLTLAKPAITPAAQLSARDFLQGREIVGTDPRDQYDQSGLPGYCTANVLCYQGCFQQIVPKGQCKGCPGCDPL
ncbi:hypothetical protein PG985_008288 [Apiospora marii]|uniref:Uncharacterized protein n=1 Tax=Apiospora marii TaxID=335849 RepID=A0ABR1SRI5_9PEZI